MALRLLVLLTACFLALPAAAEDILARLAEPRTHAIMRHALAPGSADPADFDLNRCETQRNLSEDGRRQARRAGDLIRATGVQIDHVWSSRYCRCLDTATEMAIGAVEARGFLNSFVRFRTRATSQTRETREALAALPPDQTAFLVSHNVNGEALTGTRPISGEIQVIQVSETGAVTLLGSVRVPVF